MTVNEWIAAAGEPVQWAIVEGEVIACTITTRAADRLWQLVCRRNQVLPLEGMPVVIWAGDRQFAASVHALSWRS
jgi:hypothetical protein